MRLSRSQVYFAVRFINWFIMMNRKWIHQDKIKPEGLTTTSRMPNGMLMFFTANDKGEMKPVHECLTVESGERSCCS